jgi:hypothetical protein
MHSKGQISCSPELRPVPDMWKILRMPPFASAGLCRTALSLSLLFWRFSLGFGTGASGLWSTYLHRCPVVFEVIHASHRHLSPPVAQTVPKVWDSKGFRVAAEGEQSVATAQVASAWARPLRPHTKNHLLLLPAGRRAWGEPAAGLGRCGSWGTCGTVPFLPTLGASWCRLAPVPPAAA